MSDNHLESTRFDTRTQQLDLRRGAFAKDELEAHLASLPDEAEHAVSSDVRFSGAWARKARGR